PDGNIAFAKCFELVDQHDKHVGDGWKDEIDNLMTFAGLFSAVVTGFLTGSFQWLQDDPTSRTADTLAEILHILSNTTNIPATPAPVVLPSVSTSAAVHINILWFLSLVLSLGAALTGLLCKQWIR
ncbi:hypothetical protein FISHEDRAFT_6676, partial [Fistulina hepatica ATCC 64428]